MHHHGLRIVSLDVDLETMAPKLDLLESLITSKTVALLLAHIYGKWFDTGPFVAAAKKHNIKVSYLQSHIVAAAAQFELVHVRHTETVPVCLL